MTRIHQALEMYYYGNTSLVLGGHMSSPKFSKTTVRGKRFSIFKLMKAYVQVVRHEFSNHNILERG